MGISIRLGTLQEKVAIYQPFDPRHCQFIFLGLSSFSSQMKGLNSIRTPFQLCDFFILVFSVVVGAEERAYVTKMDREKIINCYRTERCRRVTCMVVMKGKVHKKIRVQISSSCQLIFQHKLISTNKYLCSIDYMPVIVIRA